MEVLPSPGRQVHYYPGTNDDEIVPAVGEKFATALVTGVVDKEKGLINLIVFPDDGEGVGIPRKLISQHGKPVPEGARYGVYWNWPPRV